VVDKKLNSGHFDAIHSSNRHQARLESRGDITNCKQPVPGMACGVWDLRAAAGPEPLLKRPRYTSAEEFGRNTN
jgi:hypothetical protein